MNLSEHFTLAEFTASQTASRLGIPNQPTPEALRALERTAAGMERVRKALYDAPILISSGYRCAELNTLVNGSHGSQHLIGEACDFTAPRFGTPEQIMRALVGTDVGYDQIILEFYNPRTGAGWVHISFSDRNRKQALIIDHGGPRLWNS